MAKDDASNNTKAGLGLARSNLSDSAVIDLNGNNNGGSQQLPRTPSSIKAKSLDPTSKLLAQGVRVVHATRNCNRVLTTQRPLGGESIACARN